MPALSILVSVVCAPVTNPKDSTPVCVSVTTSPDSSSGYVKVRGLWPPPVPETGVETLHIVPSNR